MSIWDAPIKAEGDSVTDSYTYKMAGRYTDAISRPQLSFKEGDRTVVVSEMLMRLEYILQRAVPNYDELSKQFDAIRDIQRSNNDIR
jgi:hypothetical protein